MQIQVNTDRNIEGDSSLVEHVEAVIGRVFDRFSSQITRIEVHLGDENSSHKGGVRDKRCVLEARLAHLQPIAVSHEASTVELALDGAVAQLKRSLESRLGRLRKRS
jgi:ribosome-associated translation inhibitor RaiA